MATIMQLYKTPPHGEHGDGGMDDYKKKLFHHRAGRGIRFLVCVVVVLVVILGLWLWSRNRTYTGYEVVSSTEHSSTVNTQYAEYGGYLLRYSRDGISCVDSREEAVWSQTYNMQYPILDICGSSAAVADRQGNEAYIFGEDGLKSQITTRLPIQQISVSSQGVTALLLDGGSVSWIYLYDREGNVLAESRCSLDETGQPLSISISQDGTKLAVSYLQVHNGAAASCIVFYNFGSVGNNFVDKIVSSKIYEGTVIPRVEYLSGSVCAAVSSHGLIYYEGAEIPEETASVEIQAEILSVFFGGQLRGNHHGRGTASVARGVRGGCRGDRWDGRGRRPFPGKPLQYRREASAVRKNQPGIHPGEDLRRNADSLRGGGLRDIQHAGRAQIRRLLWDRHGRPLQGKRIPKVYGSIFGSDRYH